jgi:hypothetical protein
MIRLTCDQDNELERRKFADEDSIESHRDQCNSYSHERHLPSQNGRTGIDEYDQALDL